MSELARSLRKQADGGFPHGNPLVNIGVSADVLDLGLTEDELYDYLVKGVARQLVMRIHPDRVGPDKRPDLELLQRKYTRVYEELQDRPTFNKALAEFRNLKSEERSEIRVLRRVLESSRQSLDSYRAKEVELTRGVGRLKQDRLRFDEEDARQRLIVPNLEASIKGLEAHNSRLRTLNRSRGSKNQDLLRYIALLGGDNTYHAKGVFAFEAKWVIAAMLIPSMVTHKVPSATRDRKWKPEFLSAVEPLGVPQDQLEAVLRQWKKSSTLLKTPVEKELDRAAGLRMIAFQLNEGKMKVVWGWDSIRFRGNRVIGCIPSTTMQIGRQQLIELPSLDTMFYHLTPMLTVGGLLVSTLVKKASTIDMTGRLFAQIRREAGMVILGVG